MVTQIRESNPKEYLFVVDSDEYPSGRYNTNLTYVQEVQKNWLLIW